MALTIDAQGIYYAELNERIRGAIRDGERDIRLTGVVGQRYIGAGLSTEGVKITIEGTPGEDLAAFMAGPTIEVRGNAQNGVANTMNDGMVIVHGLAGDVVGYAMRGGRVYVRGDVGYRVGIHMKGYMDKQPILVVGGRAGDFFGEYQAGGCLVLLGLSSAGKDEPRPRAVVGDYCGTGMHGGVMYVRGQIRPDHLGKEVKTFDLDDGDTGRLKPILAEFASLFEIDTDIFDFHRYHKIIPVSTRPYSQLYAY
jgi:glutamate synthase domain-containing protein 3